MKLFGSHRVLYLLPVWATAILLYAVAAVPILVLRDIFEGMPYNVAYSAFVGDAPLIVVALICATILQRGEPLPKWLQGIEYHDLAFVIGAAFGIAWCWIDRPPYWGDFYHHLIVASLFMYLGITVVPVIFKNGTKREVVATLCMVAIWAGLVVFDFSHQRINQRQWLQSHGVTLKK